MKKIEKNNCHYRDCEAITDNLSRIFYTVIPDLIGYLSRIKMEVAEIPGSRLSSCPRMTGKALSSRGRAESSDVVISCDKVLMNIRNHYCMSHLFSEIATSAFRLLAMTPSTLALAAVLSLNTIGESWAINCVLSDNGTKLTITGSSEDAQEVYNGDCTGSYPSLQTLEFGKGITSITNSGGFTLSNAKKLIAPYVESIGDGAFWYSGFNYIEIPNATTLGASALGYSVINHKINYVEAAPQFSAETFGLADGVCNTKDGHMFCGSCGSGQYAKSGTGCVAECGEGYTADSTTGRCNKNSSGSQVSESSCYANGQVYWDNACVDEYPFAKKHWTPAEANQWLKDEDNTVIMTFKINR